MVAEVASLILFPTPIFLFNSVQKPVFTAERPWFLTYCLVINNLIDLERWNPELSLAVKLRGEAVLPALSLFFAPFAVIVRLFSRRFSHVSCPKEITVWSFLPNIARSL